MKADLLCIGGAHWDIIASAFERIGDGADVPGRILRRPGGVALNVAIAASRLGLPTTLLAPIGGDRAGDELIGRASAMKVDCTHVHRELPSCDAYVAIEEPSGALRAAVADCVGLESVGEALLDPIMNSNFDWPTTVFVDGNLSLSTLVKLARAKPQATRLVGAAASPAKAARLQDIARKCGSTLYLNRVEAEAICGCSLTDSRIAVETLLRQGVKEVVVTDGERMAAHGSAEFVTTVAPESFVAGGVTGAGDVFVATHISATIMAVDPESALRQACQGAAQHIKENAL